MSHEEKGKSAAGPIRTELLRTRRSVRNFTTDEVSEALLRQVVDAATCAPSACNEQGWRFIAVRSDAVRRRLVEAGGSPLIEKAPCGILVTYLCTTRNTEYRDDVQSAAAAVQNLLLAAHARGLGACWICHLPSPAFLRRLFSIPWYHAPVAYVLLGKPAGAPPPAVARKHSIDSILGFETFPAVADEHPPSRLTVAFQRLLVWLYRRSPLFLKRLVFNRLVDKRFRQRFEA